MNLACTLARLGDAAGTATTLGPLVAADAKDRAKWLAQVKKDKDFDKVRASAEVGALLGTTP